MQPPAATITVAGPEDLVREFRESADRERRARARWPHDYRLAMTELANLFPTMRGVCGTDPWDVDLLISWMNTGAPTSGSWCAAMFLLGVWNPTQDWREAGLKTLKKNGKAKFDFLRAVSCWDAQHMAAMQEWVKNPFWP